MLTFTRMLMLVVLAGAALPWSSIASADNRLSSHHSALRRMEARNQAVHYEGVVHHDEVDWNDGGCCDSCGDSCCDGCCDDCCDLCCEDCCEDECFFRCGLYGAFEAVLVVPHFSRDPAFFVGNDPQVSPGVNFREVAFDWDMEFSPRAELGFVNPCGVGGRVRYWNFDQSATSSIAVADAIFAGFEGDGVEITFDDADSIVATHNLEIEVLDLDATAVSCNVLYSAGIRFMSMEQSYRAVATGVGADNIIQAGHDLEAFGPTLAVDYVRPVNCCLSGFVKARLAVLYGESNFRAQNTTGIDVLLRSNEHDLLGTTEIQLGAHWRKCLCCGSTLFVTGALEAQYWMNAGTGLQGPEDESAQSPDLGFFGFNIGAGYMF